MTWLRSLSIFWAVVTLPEKNHQNYEFNDLQEEYFIYLDDLSDEDSVGSEDETDHRDVAFMVVN